MTEGETSVDRLVAIWCELLNTTKVGADDDFYDLGGHSVFALRLASRVATDFGVELGLDDVLTLRTPNALGQRIDALIHEATSR